MTAKVISLLINVFIDLVLFFVSLVMATSVSFAIFYGRCFYFALTIPAPDSFKDVSKDSLCGFSPWVHLVLIFCLFILLIILKEKLINKFKRK